MSVNAVLGLGPTITRPEKCWLAALVVLTRPYLVAWPSVNKEVRVELLLVRCGNSLLLSHRGHPRLRPRITLPVRRPCC